ncbi:hypothetical protein B0H34DRAFT_690224 [Crassisporium funariophilum]|nr:hypothetical protein B0H34DRAFT_690224 [Crassisporium funariophilum]
MPASLRSSTSAHNSPSGKTNSVDSSTTPTTTPRKAPHCSKCKRPRAGHPRSGCPFVDSPSHDAKTQEKKTGATDGHLSVALGSMKLASPARVERDEDTKAYIRNRRRLSAQPITLGPSASLLSLDTNSDEIVARLLQPGSFDDIDTEEQAGGAKPSRVIRWQDTLLATPGTQNRALKTKTPARSPMPGTLFPPTPETSFASSIVSQPKQEIPTKMTPMADRVSMGTCSVGNPSESSSTSTRRGPPLGRTMSATERDVFVSKLTNEAAATIYIVPKADLDSIVDEAASLKFFAHQVMNEDENDPQALLILGRDEVAVEALLRRVEIENEKARSSRMHNKERGNRKTSALRAAAGGAMVGVVGAWAGLAFS